MTKPGKIRNVPLKLLSSVYKPTGPKEQSIDESSDTSEGSGETSSSGETLRMKSLIDYWKCHPLEDVRKATGFILRYALSGNEHLVIFISMSAKALNYKSTSH